MAGGSRIWKALGDISLVQWCLSFVGISSVAGIAWYLASLNALLRLFAPFSYLVAALLAVALSAALLLVLLKTVRAFTGYKPAYRPKAPARLRSDAPFPEVTRWILSESASGARLSTIADDGERTLALDCEIMDRVGQCEMTVWGRAHHLPFRPITEMGQWQFCRVDSMAHAVTRLPANIGGNRLLFYQVAFNWRQVRKVWPRKRWWN